MADLTSATSRRPSAMASLTSATSREPSVTPAEPSGTACPRSGRVRSPRSRPTCRAGHDDRTRITGPVETLPARSRYHPAGMEGGTSRKRAYRPGHLHSRRRHHTAFFVFRTPPTFTAGAVPSRSLGGSGPRQAAREHLWRSRLPAYLGGFSQVTASQGVTEHPGTSGWLARESRIRQGGATMARVKLSEDEPFEDRRSAPECPELQTAVHEAERDSADWVTACPQR
jgi:hypothetical protein